jgi:hypothetical protein
VPRARSAGSGRAVVLDNEAVQAATDRTHRKHRRLIETLEATGLRRRMVVVVPTAVRVEAGVSREDRSAIGLWRLKVEDVTLTGSRADRAIALNAAGACVVDATVAQCAEELAATGRLVTVYTSDVRDLERLCGASTEQIAVRRV